MENALKGLVMAAGVVVTCIIIGIGFFIARESGAMAGDSAGELSELRKELSEGSLTRYDGLEVAGSDVINLCRKQLESYSENQVADLYISIKNSGKIYTYVNRIHLDELREIKSSRYINSAQVYVGKIIRDKNDIIIGIYFEPK